MKKLIFVLLFLLALPGLAELKLATPFCDHAVLQQGKKVPVWGKTERDYNFWRNFDTPSKSKKRERGGMDDCR